MFSLFDPKKVIAQQPSDFSTAGFRRPCNSASSSALLVCWIKFLLTVSGHEQARNADFIARMAHRAEVLEFNEPGGMMDQYATAVGGILYMEFTDPVKLQPVNSDLGTFVLGDSLQPKDTMHILHRVKYGVLDAVNIINQSDHGFNLNQAQIDSINQYQSLLSADQFDCN